MKIFPFPSAAGVGGFPETAAGSTGLLLLPSKTWAMVAGSALGSLNRVTSEVAYDLEDVLTEHIQTCA